MLGLKDFRDKAKGLPDLLPYCLMPTDGIMVSKNGAMTAGFYYRGADISSATNAERNSLSARINSSLARFGSGWMTHHDAVRIQAQAYPEKEKSRFPDLVTALIEEERRDHFQSTRTHYESLYVFTITYCPPLERTSKVSDMLYDDDLSETKNLETRLLEQFEQKVNELEDSLSTAVRISRMRGTVFVDEFGLEHNCNELLQFINYAITGVNHPIIVPSCTMYADAYIGKKTLYGGVTPKLDDKFIGVLAIDGFPMESYPGILSMLDKAPVEYRWSTRFIYMDAIEAMEHLNKYRKKWQQKVRGFKDQVFKTNSTAIDQDALSMVVETETALAEASSNVVTYGYFTSNVVFMDEDREFMEENMRLLKRDIENMGFNCRIEQENAMEAWLGSLPGFGEANVRRPIMHTMNLADMLPLASIWPGEEHAPCPFYPEESPALLHCATEGSTPFRLNLHVGDLGHTLIVGPTGAGKSTLLALIVAQFFRYPNATVNVFDKGNSMLPLVLGAEGAHYEIAGDDGGPQFCPLSGIDNPNELSWACDWIESLLVLQGVAVTPTQRKEIYQAMELLSNAPIENRTITEFQITLQDTTLRDAIEAYTIAGSMGRLLDNHQDDLRGGNFQVFELEHLMNLGEKSVIPVITYLFHRIEQSLKGQPAMLVLDEAWIMLGHPVFREKIREWLKVLRKANCCVVMATQSLGDAAKSGIMDVLLESCPTKILLPNPEAKNEGAGDTIGPYEFYASIGLNERQIEIISTAIPKRQYYYVSPEGRRLFELALGPTALAFVGASGKEDIARIKELKSQYGNEWVNRWLEERGVTRRIEPITTSLAA